MNKKTDKDFEDDELNMEDEDNVTKYGEQVCTRFAWLPLEKQKEKANKFDKITKKEN